MESLTFAGWGLIIGFIGLAIMACSSLIDIIESEFRRNPYNIKISYFIYRCGLVVIVIGGVITVVGVTWQLIIRPLFMGY